MTGAGHPFATAGGGTLFEYKVATLLAADLIRSRLNEHQGVVVALGMQTGPVGFDDLLISLELLDGSHRTVHAQCRHRQPFTATDAKFITLLTHAEAAVKGSEASFVSGERRLAVIVDERSPGHAAMAELCELTRGPGEFARFVSAVEAHSGRVVKRWRQCLQAAAGIEPAVLRRVLAALEIRSVDVRSETSRDSVELLNRLAECWDPPDFVRAANLGNGLFRHLTDIGPTAGAIDQRSLQAHLGTHIPATLGATTRRTRLSRRRDASRRRVASTLRAIGLDDDEADALATRALATAPSITAPMGLTVVTGAMGVGKSTELERLHRWAIDRALEDPNAPIPMFLHGREVGRAPLLAAAENQATGLGDPSRLGAHLVIDGLDEVGIQLSELPARVATLLAAWPRSTVIISSRPQSPQAEFNAEEIAPLSEEAAVELMTVVHSDADRGLPLRKELTEVLRRPLFAIRYALDRRNGRPAGIHEAQLVESIGWQAVADLGDADEAMFELLVRLACRVVESGGRTVDPRSLETTPVQIGQIMRSRVIQVVDGRLSFQLAALTEWFAASALLRNSGVLEDSVSSPLLARRWRYALVQAMLQGSGNDVDRIMSTLLTHAPATAAWVHDNAKMPYTQERTTPPSATALEAGERVRRAARAWLEPWPELVRRRTVRGEMPTLGVSMQGPHLATAWHTKKLDATQAVIPLPADAHPLRRSDSSWTGWRIGRPSSGEMWPWEWTRDHVQEQIDEWLANRERFAEIEICWPELAWDYAHKMVDRNPVVESKPVRRSELEAAIAKVRAHVPEGDVQVSRYGYGWRLSQGESFVADLVRLGIQEIDPPWPPADTRGGWTWSFWTTEQLLARLRLTTKAGLDVYRALVERHIPSMASQLSTYQLLPARVIGTLTPDNPSQGYQGQPGYSWRLEPLPAGSSNEAQWHVEEPGGWPDEAEWESRIAAVRSLRGDVAEYVELFVHEGEPEVYSSTPAGSFALDLLASDLYRFKWITGLARIGSDSRSARPRYT